VVPLRLELLPPPDFLLEMFENEAPDQWLLHCDIAERLGLLGDEMGLVILSLLLRHPHSIVRSYAAIAVGQIRGESGIKLLENAMKEEADKEVITSIWIGMLNQGKTKHFSELLFQLEVLSDEDLMKVCHQLMSLVETKSLEGIESEIQRLLCFLEQKAEVVTDKVLYGSIDSLHNSLKHKLK